MSDVIQYYVKDNIGFLKLNNPPQNRMNIEFIESFTELINKVDDHKITGLVLHGEGRHFSSGADVDELVELSNGRTDFFTVNIRNFNWLESRPYPTIAAVSGCALGFGLELALCCTCRIATASAIFSLPESSFGLVPGCGGSIRLPALIGRSQSIEMILRGNMIGSEDALKMGLIDKIVEKKELLNEAELIAKKLY